MSTVLTEDNYVLVKIVEHQEDLSNTGFSGGIKRIKGVW